MVAPFRAILNRAISVGFSARYHAVMEFFIILIIVLVAAAAIGLLVESLAGEAGV